MEVDITVNSTKKTRIVIAEAFSQYPAGRYPGDGKFNGTTFRRDYLVPALRDSDIVEVIFDGVAGFGSSFLEEAFGGLVREQGFGKEFLDNHLFLSTTEQDLEDDIDLAKKYITEAAGMK